MAGAIFAFATGILLFALAGDAQTQWLEIAGIVAATYFIVIGAIAGWQAARK